MNWTDYAFRANEVLMLAVFDLEVSIGLDWCSSVRDEFRYMWE